MSDQLERQTLLCASTAHVTAADAKRLAQVADTLPLAVWARPEGFLISTQTAPDAGDGFSPALVEALSFARQLGFDWLMLDRDGPLIGSLPTFDW